MYDLVPSIDNKIFFVFLQCLDENYLKQSLDLINCTSPWITSNKKLWCKNMEISTVEQKEKIEHFFASIIDENADEGQCIQPCLNSR